MDHALWPQVAAGIVASQSGDAEQAREQLVEVWSALGEDDHALRCIVAHYLADLQDDLRSELEWDQKALAAHRHIRDEELTSLGLPSAAAFLPSLHLNLGDAWLRAGDRAQAHRHLDRARAAEDALGQDPYGDMVRRGLAGLSARLDTRSGVVAPDRSAPTARPM